ncbi:MAG: DUF222 domain-containing protein [Corynebacterium sp.]|uniref:HNH endonuclease signature motif containing protein n=1 Tax=Corynebacterium sp. TaxID=1720 RepID=UPI0026DFF5F5|nr:HNH endonuclease signature motif containing protein [Corynebacterium sp.]MDO5668679.1 DUF222 domain-containing protein [Corynebacterium sp.]
MTTREKSATAVAQIREGMAALREIMESPSGELFEDVAESFEELETVLAGKAALDASFAWVADKADAGRRVGSSRSFEYLIKRLGISKQEALSRLRAGASLFDPPAPPPPPPPKEDPEEAAERERREKAKQERRRRAQEEARRQAAERSAEILRIIEQQLANLNETADPSREELFSAALTEAATRTPEDLRDWLRHEVTKANRAGVRDPLAAYRKRHIHLGKPDSDGGRRLSGYLPAADAALFAAIMAKGEQAGANLPPDTPETRTLAQRRLDQLVKTLQASAAIDQSATRYGVGSILLSLTAEDIDTLSASSEFATNTGDTLTPIDLLRLGAAQYDIMALHDSNGQTLTLGRGHRLASFWQRIALYAAEGVCTCSDCTTAFIHLDIHHLRPWDQGGSTDMINLTGICRPHHGDNDDSRTGRGGRGWMVRCPTTGRVGRRAGPGQPIEFNETHGQQRSNGARIRTRQTAAAQ